MKNIFSTLIAILIIHYSNGQNTPWSTSGPIGIGTTTPNYTLQLGGNIWSNLGSNYTLAVAGDVAVGNATSGSQPKLTIIEGTHGTGTTIQKFNGYTTISDGQGVINLNSNVGIGTTNPLFPLSISTGASGDAMRITNTSSGNAVIEYFTSEGSQTYMGQVPGSWGGLTNSPSVYESNRTICITPVLNTPQSGINLLTNGNVLIGQISQVNSAYKLDVAGNVRANQIVVNSTGADFVFEPSYRLHSLSSLKKYIVQNHHLPEIPSAKQMQADGLNVGDNQVKLLQKVEELTLYTIASDKNINQEKTIITQQQAMLSQQQAMLSQQQSQLKAQQDEIKLLKQQVSILIKAKK